MIPKWHIYIYVINFKDLSRKDLDFLWNYLSENELEYVAEIDHEQTKSQYIVSRAIKRFILSLILWISKEELIFIKDLYWKESVIMAGNYKQRFSSYSLSHTKDLIVFAVSESQSLWIDVERSDSNFRFTESEFHDIFLPSESQKIISDSSGIMFYIHWTIKEALSKAKGLWLNMNFEDILINIDNKIGGSVFNHWKEWDFIVLLVNDKYYCSLVYEKTPKHDIYINELHINQDVGIDFQFLHQSKPHNFHKNSISLL